MWSTNNNMLGFQVMVDGKAIGDIESLTVERSLTSKNTEVLPVKRSFGGTLEKVQMSPLFERMIGDTLTSFDLVTTNFRSKPPKKPRSKKKRIQKKWAKQYEASIGESVTYKDCTIGTSLWGYIE